MTSRARLLFPLLFLLPQLIWAQINDCENAQVVCDNQDLEFNPLGPGHNDFADPDNNQGCITALEQNSAWYYFQISPTAPPDLVLGFTIHPNGGLGEDYDWALFGPNVNCGELGSPIRCSSSSAACDFCPETGMGMGATDVTEGPGTGDGFVMTLVVQPGQGFYLLIDNWLGTTNGFVMEWTGTAADYLDCTAKPPCALDAHAGNDISACQNGTFQLNGSSTGNHGGETYSWSGTNGGTGFLSDPMVQNPTGTLPPGFTGMITYTITVVEDTCMSEDEMIVTVYPTPMVQINPAGPYCPNQGPQTLTGTPSGGMWGGAATGNTFNPSTHGPGTHTVTYTYTDSHGCMATASRDIIVHEGPEVSVDPSPLAFCESELSQLLTASATGGPGGYTYHWSTPTGTADAPTYAATASGLHAVTVTDMNGCTDSTAVNVTVYINPVIVINDPGPICGELPFFTFTAAPSGGTFDGDWISPQGDIIPNTIAPGTYTISYTFVDNHNCESTEYLQYTILPIPEASASNNGPICDGQQIQLTGQFTGTGNFITFHWIGPNGYTSNLQNPTDATDPGDYFFQVVIDDCPSVEVWTTVVVHDAPEATATNGGPYCNGEIIELFGSINESGNVITYAWTGPGGYVSDVQNPLNATAPGTYTLVVTLDGCPSAPVMTLVEFGAAPDATAANSGPYCAGDAIALSGNTMTAGTVINYQWLGPNGYASTVQNPTDATEAGLYQLIVEVDGCKSDTAATMVVINPLPQPVITGPQTFCTGFSSVLDAGAGYQSYVWDDNSMNRTREVFASGTYTVTVTDMQGCTGSAQLTVTENSSLTPTITGTLAFCAGSSTMLDAGAGFAMYQWSTGAMSQTINVNNQGNIAVTVTDASGCTGVAAVSTTVYPTPNVVIGGSTTYCIGGSTVLDAGGFAQYLWSTTAVTPTITVATPGMYAVTVTDINGCTGSASVNVTESTSLNPVITGSVNYCEGGSTTLNAGSGFATYIWSTTAVTQTITVSTPGTYSVTVSDGQGCSGETSVTVSEVQPPVATLQSDTTICNTTAGGSLLNLYSLVLSGDMNGTWQDLDNSGAMGLFNNLNFANRPAGNYRFLYTTQSAVAPCPEETYQITVILLDCACPEVSFTNPGGLCNAGDMLNISSVINTSETGIWSILQAPPGSNPATLAGGIFDATGGDAGDYDLQFTLQNQPPPGCPLDYQVTLSVDASVDAGLAGPPVELCAGTAQTIDLKSMVIGADANGVWSEISATPSQGGAFSAGNATFNTANQVAGTYRFRYFLASGGACPDDETEVVVTIHPLPVAVIAGGVVIDCATPVQTLDATGSSSGAQYSVTWTGPGILADGNETTLHPTVDAPGMYVLTIEHTLTGCLATASVQVTANTDPPTGALITTKNPGCSGEQNGFIHLSQVIGGSAPYTYSLNQAIPGTEPNFNTLSAGTYALAIEDINGCRWDTTITLIAPQPFTIDVGPDIEIRLGESAMVQAAVSLLPNQIDTLIWSPDRFLTCVDLSCLEAEVHTFAPLTLTATVYDENGCAESDAIVINVDRTRHIFFPTVFSPNGDGNNDMFYIIGDPNQIESINVFRIYDRWGALMFEIPNIVPNEPSLGWDGSFRSKPVLPGVYTYMAEVKFIDRVVMYSGDVTLVR